MPLAGSTRDVLGPIARCVRDAALTLDVLAGYTAEDPKTVAGIGQRPKGGYAAGLKAGDVVTSFDGVPITSSTDLTAQVRFLPAGSTTDLTYVRNGESTTVKVTLGTLK